MTKTFTPAETEIFPFTYPDGTEGRLDPLGVRRRLTVGTSGLVDELLDTATRRPEKGSHQSAYEWAQAQEKLIRACPYAFEVQGATEQWYWDTLLAFDAWLQKKRTSGQTKSTSPPPVDSAPDSLSATSSGA